MQPVPDKSSGPSARGVLQRMGQSADKVRLLSWRVFGLVHCVGQSANCTRAIVANNSGSMRAWRSKPLPHLVAIKAHRMLPSQSDTTQAMSTGNADPTTLLRALVTCSKSDGASNSFAMLKASSSEMGFRILYIAKQPIRLSSIRTSMPRLCICALFQVRTCRVT